MNSKSAFSLSAAIFSAIGLILATGACDDEIEEYERVPESAESSELEDVEEIDENEVVEDHRLETADELLMNSATEATNAGRLGEALAQWQALEDSEDSFARWAGVSGQILVHRLEHDTDSARDLTARVAAQRPELDGLMLLWDADTLMLVGRVNEAKSLYEQVAARSDVVDGMPIGLQAIETLTLATLAEGNPARAAELQRDALARFPTHREHKLAEVLAYETMARGELPTMPLNVLVEEGFCSDDDPCSVGQGDAIDLGVSGIEAYSDAADKDLLEIEITTPSGQSRAACTPSKASDGFMMPIYNDHYGDLFMSYPAAAGGYHPGVDLNGVGNDDDVTIRAAARGCVTSANKVNQKITSGWGSATLKHYYLPAQSSGKYWTTQYGHADYIYYSVGSAVTRGVSFGSVGSVAAASPHLHFEIREPDHPNPSNSSYWSTYSKSSVGDHYADPVAFISTHTSYKTLVWFDEGAMSRSGWTAKYGVGDEDDLNYASTTTSSTPTATASRSYTPTYSGYYRLYMHVPYNYATSENVPVTIKTSGGTTKLDRRVNQFYGTNGQSGHGCGEGTGGSQHWMGELCDEWVYVGLAYLYGGSKYTVTVTNATGESGRYVAIDDFLLIRK